VEISTDDQELGRPSTLKGKNSSFRYSSLKRTADDDDAGPSGIASDTVNRTESSQPHFSQGIVTHNRFSCLSQDENITEEHALRTQLYDRDTARTSTHNTRRKRFARDSDTENGPDEHTQGPTQLTNLREKKLPPIYLTSKVKNYLTFAKALKESVGDNFQLKFLGKQIKIQFLKVKDFMDFKKFAIEMNYAFHTYSLPNEKTLIVTLKGLPNITNLSKKNLPHSE